MTRRGHGEGTIYRRADGRWEAALWSAGSRQRWVGRTRTEVARHLTAALHAREAGAAVAGPRRTLAAFWADWLPGMRPHLRPRVWQLYEQVGRSHLLPILGPVPLGRLGPGQVRALHEAMLSAGLSPTTARHAHRVLHRALADAVRWGLVARNVAGLVTPPRAAAPEMQTLTSSQVRDLLMAAKGDRLEALYVVAVTTGMRQGELLGLRWRDVDLERARIAVTAALQASGPQPSWSEPKTARSRRQVALTNGAVVALRAHRMRQLTERLAAGAAWNELDLVFAGPTGRPLVRQTVLRGGLRRLLDRAELPAIRFHDLRHTAASLLLAQGVHPKVASEMLGHASVAITLDRYSHVTETLQREAVTRIDALLDPRPGSAGDG